MLGTLASLVRALVILVAVGSLAAAAVPVVRHLGGQSAASVPAPAPAVAAADAPAPPDLGPILDLAPFGTVAAAPAPEAAVGETTLDLVLQGVVLQDDPDASTAFISHDGGTMGYQPGDAVTDRGRLVEVAADHAVLEVDGNLQTLSFPDPARDAGMEADVAEGADLGVPPEPDPGPEAFPDPADSMPAPGASALSGPERLRQMVAAQTQEDEGEGEEGPGDDPAEEGDDPEAHPSGTEAPQNVEDRIDLWRERIRENPQELLDSIGLIPDADGYRIAEQHDGGVDLAGLRAGDVITSVNGQAVGDVDRDRQLFDEVVASGQARLEVLRDGGVLVLTFPLQ